MTAQWQLYREPLRVTLVRNGIIALVLGVLLAQLLGWSPARWPVSILLMLWPSFGGHWVELWFLNWLRPRLADQRAAQVAARVATWFVGGVALGAGVWLTAAGPARPRPPRPGGWRAPRVAGGRVHRPRAAGP